MRRARLIVLGLLLLAPSAHAAPLVVAERAGPLRAGVPAHPEGSLAGIRASAALGAVVGLNVAVSADGVPLAFADLRLERLTACAGRVDARPVADLAACPVRWLGTPGGPLAAASASVPAPIATVRRALEVAGAADARVLLRLGPEDLARLPAILAAVPDAVEPGRIVVASAAPRVLALVRARLPEAERALVTDPPGDLGAPAAAAAAGHAWVAPGGAVDAAYLAETRARGRRVLAAGAEDAGTVAALAALGVDAVATHDPAAAAAVLGLPPAPPPPPPEAAGEDPAAAPELLFPSLASEASARPRVVLRWRAGEGSADAGAYDVEVRPRGAESEADWRALVADAPPTQATYTGAPGRTYDVRARSRPAGSAPGPWGVAPLVVPRDEPRARGWSRVRRRGAWAGRVGVARRPGATLALRFQGTSVAVIAPRTPEAGRLRITLDGRSSVVSARGPAAARQVVWSSPRLAAGSHRLVLRSLGGGPVAVDAIAPTEGAVPAAGRPRTGP